MSNECGETETELVEYVAVSRAEFEETRQQVKEIHRMLTEFSKVLNMAASNPMLSAFIPRGL